MPKKEIALKPCPICGSMPNHRAEDMGGANYQHYYGCTDFIYECPTCKQLYASACNVYTKTTDEARQNAKKAWNKECEKYEKFLAWRTPSNTIAVNKSLVEGAKKRLDDQLEYEDSAYARGSLSVLDDILEGRLS